MGAAIELYKATELDKYRDFAVDYARRLSVLQVKEAIDSNLPIRGFYLSSSTNSEPYRDIWYGCWHLIALCDSIETFPEHPDVIKCREAVTLYSQDYLLAMSRLIM